MSFLLISCSYVYKLMNYAQKKIAIKQVDRLIVLTSVFPYLEDMDILSWIWIPLSKDLYM